MQHALTYAPLLILTLGTLLAACDPLLGEPIRCSCEDIASTSTCRELSGPFEETSTYDRLCEDLSSNCQGTYAQAPCPNPDRVAVCNRPLESFTESKVLYTSGGAPLGVGEDATAACEGYGLPEYY